MTNVFKRYWWIPTRSSNVTDVPNLLDKFGIHYRAFDVIDMETRELVGYVYEFNCIPVLYHTLKLAVSGGNSFHPLEFAFTTK